MIKTHVLLHGCCVYKAKHCSVAHCNGGSQGTSVQRVLGMIVQSKRRHSHTNTDKFPSTTQKPNELWSRFVFSTTFRLSWNLQHLFYTFIILLKDLLSFEGSRQASNTSVSCDAFDSFQYSHVNIYIYTFKHMLMAMYIWSFSRYSNSVPTRLQV